jgi:hypothetical protein
MCQFLGATGNPITQPVQMETEHVPVFGGAFILIWFSLVEERKREKMSDIDKANLVR